MLYELIFFRMIALQLHLADDPDVAVGIFCHRLYVARTVAQLTKRRKVWLGIV